MKHTKFYAALLMAFAAVSCTEPKVDTPKGDGLLNFIVKIPDEPGEYSATKKGPYAPGEEIVVQIPSSYENPVDITALEAYASFDNDCYADPAVPSIIDFTEPYTINVVLADGSIQTNTIRIEFVYPRIKVEKLWTKDNNALQCQYTHWLNLAVDDKYVYVLDAVQNVGDKIKILDRLTGETVKEIDTPTSLIAQIHIDAGGRLIATRYNMYGAGFRLYIYDPDSNSWSDPVIDYLTDETIGLYLPEDLGERASLVGDLKKGKAYVYATAPNSSNYYCWEFNDGVPSKEPEIKRYAGVKEDWTKCMVKRVSTEPDANLYFGYTKYTGVEETCYAGFDMVTPGMDVYSISQENYGPRVLNYQPFTVNGENWLALAYQCTYTRWSGSRLAIFDVNNLDNWTMLPEDDGYMFNFRLYNSDDWGGTNYEQNAGMAVYTTDDAAFIYVSASAKGGDPVEDNTRSGVTCYKMTYTK
ncbi:MAG: hypothetical protein ACI3ZK_02340 [Candidatus Cryptobacteroides sp.]